MNQKFTFPTLLTICALAFCKLSFATIITVTGGNAPYTLNPGDTLFIASGTYTGTVSGLNANTKTIIVANGATFQPTSLVPTNGVVCKMKIYGTFAYSQPLTTNTNFTIDNYAGGIVTLAAMNTKGRDQVWTNHFGGTMNFTGDVLVNGGTASDDNNVFINYETINALSDFQMNSGSKFFNYKEFNVTGDFIANGGIISNHGRLEVTGKIDLNSGASSITNYCRMEASGGIEVSNGNFINYNYLWAKNSDITVTSGTILNILMPGNNPPIIHGRNYTQSGGAVTGPANLYFYGTTSTSGSATVGVTGVTADTIKMNDITRTSPTRIFDIQGTGTVRPNVIYNAWGVPDSTRVYLIGCSTELLLEVPLAISWNYFYVALNDNIPNLSWSAEYDPGTVFEVQRSYDGTNFYGIKDVASEVGRSDYKHDDRMVNTRSPFVYYRIKASEPSGETKYSETRVVRFANKQGAITYTSPNPFTSNFIINYHATEKEMLTIRMFNVSGQQKLVKNVAVNNGTNSIRVSEAANLASGIYFIQVSSGENIISSTKIIKQ